MKNKYFLSLVTPFLFGIILGWIVAVITGTSELYLLVPVGAFIATCVIAIFNTAYFIKEVNNFVRYIISSVICFFVFSLVWNNSIEEYTFFASLSGLNVLIGIYFYKTS